MLAGFTHTGSAQRIDLNRGCFRCIHHYRITFRRDTYRSISIDTCNSRGRIRLLRIIRIFRFYRLRRLHRFRWLIRHIRILRSHRFRGLFRFKRFVRLNRGYRFLRIHRIFRSHRFFRFRWINRICRFLRISRFRRLCGHSGFIRIGRIHRVCRLLRICWFFGIGRLLPICRFLWIYRFFRIRLKQETAPHLMLLVCRLTLVRHLQRHRSVSRFIEAVVTHSRRFNSCNRQSFKRLTSDECLRSNSRHRRKFHRLKSLTFFKELIAYLFDPLRNSHACQRLTAQKHASADLSQPFGQYKLLKRLADAESIMPYRSDTLRNLKTFQNATLIRVIVDGRKT